MTAPPVYFERVRHEAAEQWDLLEQRPAIAGPWHQLFKQVQSPRHVLSELLQNADDAGATEAAVRIEDGVFIFEHNGQDFSEEHFASLCRFGYSNKRSLHTIGFRGVGFKSTFSLGDRVELHTPTLAVCFERQRFTEPRWLAERPGPNGKTAIHVVIADQHRLTELEQNLDDWLKSALSLLFFRHIRRLQIGERTVHWRGDGPGPLANSEWMVRDEQRGERVLLVRSAPVVFPPEALAEIRQERLLGIADEVELPPCTVDLVLGGGGRLFVVLPTGVETRLPFACNAPFLQDPARMKIKDPAISPTNRWLLERAGQLAAVAMLAWLGDTSLPVEERARAYRWLPSGETPDATLEGSCVGRVQATFAAGIMGRPVLLTDAGTLVPARQGVIIPRTLFDVWSAEQAAALLDSQGRPPLCRQLDRVDQQRLVRWKLVEQLDKFKLLEALQLKQPPRPQTWRQLLVLWAYVAPEITSYQSTVSARRLRIVPVQGQDLLQTGAAVVRLGSGKLLRSEDDWRFLAAHLMVLDHDWLQFLAEQRRSTEQNDDRQKALKAVDAVLAWSGLGDPGDIDTIVNQAAAKFFSAKTVNRSDCVRLAQIAAKLDVTVGEKFQYVARDNHRYDVANQLLFDLNGTLEEILPAAIQQKQLLHPDYSVTFSACSSQEWWEWVQSGRARLYTFIPFVRTRSSIRGERKVEAEARQRGSIADLFYPYKTQNFILEDWDVAPACWLHWQKLAASDQQVWRKIVEGLLRLGEEVCSQNERAQLLQVATTGSERLITDEPLLPTWVLRLREQPCLPDTRGFLRKPADLVRRTRETEALLDIELFVDRLFDTEANRWLLDLLGVQSAPPGPDKLLERLRAMAQATPPLVPEVEKLYHRLDQLIDHCSTADVQKIRAAFQTQKLVLTEDGSWASVGAVFLSAEDDLPGVALVRSSVRGLTLWRKVGVAERASAEQVIAWLKTLPSGAALLADDQRRVRALLGRYPVQIWQECQHWLSLAGTWAPVEELRYSLSMQSLVAWSHLHPGVKQQVANLQDCPRDVVGAPPFAGLPTLAQQLELRLAQPRYDEGPAEQKAWLTTLGAELRRVELDTDAATERVRTLAERLARTLWRTSPALEVIPYLEDTPAGTPQQVDLAWSGDTLYVTPLPTAKLARRVPQELAKVFEHDEIKAALDYSFERTPEDIRAYLEANFTLAPPVSPAAQANGSAAASPEAYNGPAADLAPDAPGQMGGAQVAELPSNSVTMDGQEDEAAPAPHDQTTPDQEHNHQPSERPRPSPRPPQPSLIARFATAQGFQERDGRFVHPDGSWIAQNHGAPCPWERYTRAGELVRRYRTFEHCLDHAALALEADLWHLLQQQPDRYALILLDSAGQPVEVSGARLGVQLEQGLLELYPAMYRLKYTHDT